MNNGGFGSLAQVLANKGRHGDTKIGAMPKSAQSLLKASGGAGTVNPWTGLAEYYDLSQFKDADGNIRSELLGGNLNMDTDDEETIFNQLSARQEGINRGYDANLGGWGNGNYSNFLSVYDDNDGDGVWTAPNEANINRAGLDATAEREQWRQLGHAERWGAPKGVADTLGQFQQANPDFYGDSAAEANKYTSQMELLQQQESENAEALASYEASITNLMNEINSLKESVNQPAPTEGQDLETLIKGILGTSQNDDNTAVPSSVYGGATSQEGSPTSGGAFQGMVSVYNPLTGRREWVSDTNPWGGFANGLTGPSTSASSNAGRRGGFGNLIEV